MVDADVNDYLLKHLKDQEQLCMVDVGAFLGVCSEFFIQKFPHSNAYAIEACPENYKHLAKKFASNKNVYTFNLAITDCDCQTAIYVASHKKYKNSGTSQANSLYEDFLKDKAWTKDLKPVLVTGTTLGNFCEEHNIQKIDYLKINCEGCEYKIFESDTSFLKRVALIYLQMHSKSKKFRSKDFIRKRKEMLRVLEERGFSLVLGEKNLNLEKKHIHQLWAK